MVSKAKYQKVAHEFQQTQDTSYWNRFENVDDMFDADSDMEDFGSPNSDYVPRMSEDEEFSDDNDYIVEQR